MACCGDDDELMQLKTFLVPARHDGGAEAEMNAFLRGHRILAIKREFVVDLENSFWAFCAEYLEPSPASASGG